MFTLILTLLLPFAVYHSYNLYQQTKDKWSIVYFLWFALAMIVEPFSAAYIIYSLGNYVPKVDPQDRFLHDVIHSFSPYVPNAFYYFANPLVFINIACIMYLSCRNTIFRHRALFTLGTVVLLRDITMVMTQLPLTWFDVSSNPCIEYSALPYSQILAHTLQGFSCADYHFSGHTIFYSVGAFALNSLLMTTPALNNSTPKNRWLPLLIIVYIVEVLSLVISQAHYTIDVIESTFITSTVYYFISPFIVSPFRCLNNSSQTC